MLNLTHTSNDHNTVIAEASRSWKLTVFMTDFRTGSLRNPQLKWKNYNSIVLIVTLCIFQDVTFYSHNQ